MRERIAPDITRALAAKGEGVTYSPEDRCEAMCEAMREGDALTRLALARIAQRDA